MKVLFNPWSLLNCDFKFILTVWIFVNWGQIIIFRKIQTLVLGRVFVSWWRSGSITANSSILYVCIGTSIFSILKEINPRSLSILPTYFLNLILSLPSTIHLNVIQVLSLVWLFLPAWWSLPLLKLLVSKSVWIMDLNYWLHSNFSNQILKLIFNLWLLLF